MPTNIQHILCSRRGSCWADVRSGSTQRWNLTDGSSHKYRRPKKVYSFKLFSAFSFHPSFSLPLPLPENQNWIKGIQKHNFSVHLIYTKHIFPSLHLSPLSISLTSTRHTRLSSFLFHFVYFSHILSRLLRSHTSHRSTHTIVPSLWHIKERLKITNVLNFHAPRSFNAYINSVCVCVCECDHKHFFIDALGEIYSHIHIDSFWTS